MMEIAIILIMIVIGIFLYNGFRSRCPACGSYKLHPDDELANKLQREEYEMFRGIDNGGALSSRYKPNYANKQFKCLYCNHSFSRKESTIWLHTANKLGEEKAIMEYRKLKDKTKSNH